MTTTRLEVGGGHHHAHPVHAVEPAGQRALVRDSVLRGHHRDPAGRGSEVAGSSLGVLALGGEDDDLVAAPAEVARVGVRRDPERHPFLGCRQDEPLVPDRLTVGTAGDQRDVVPAWWRRAPIVPPIPPAPSTTTRTGPA
jgi:hypothetical protein